MAKDERAHFVAIRRMTPSTRQRAGEFRATCTACTFQVTATRREIERLAAKHRK